MELSGFVTFKIGAFNASGLLVSPEITVVIS
jgi:hypothetical protein